MRGMWEKDRKADRAKGGRSLTQGPYADEGVPRGWSGYAETMDGDDY